MYQTIMVPLDGSALGEQALPLACDIARRTGATLRLVHVHIPYTPEPIYVEGVPVLDDDLKSLRREHELAYLRRLSEDLPSDGAPAIAYDVLDGDGPVAVTIARDAETSGVDLIVMTTHGRSGVERLWLGSVAEGVVRSSPVPVLLLRPRDVAPATALPRPARMLIVLDGSPFAEGIIAPALELGRVVDAAYTLLRVVEPIGAHGYDPLGRIDDLVEQATQSLSAEAGAYLEAVADRLRAENATVQTRVVVAHHVAQAILEASGDAGAALIALTTRGRGGMQRLLLGSIADKVLRGAGLPVLVFNPR